MTRESIPRIDLYGELEVSRLASAAVIEAAYRSLVKRHHPDVARSKDEDRIKRLNLAREWLTDPVRRSWYDAATGSGTSIPRSGLARPAQRSSSTVRSSTPRTNGNGEAPEKTFGVNAAEVRHYLAELRVLTKQRALQVVDGRAVAHGKGYTRARRAALAAAREQRIGEWEFAREAASVIARGKLGDTPLTEHVLDVLADVAGAIALRDIIPRRDFEVLQLPWTWRGDKVVAGTQPRAKPQKPESMAEAVAAMPGSAAPVAGAAAAATASMSAPWSASAQPFAAMTPDQSTSGATDGPIEAATNSAGSATTSRPQPVSGPVFAPAAELVAAPAAEPMIPAPIEAPVPSLAPAPPAMRPISSTTSPAATQAAPVNLGPLAVPARWSLIADAATMADGATMAHPAVAPRTPPRKPLRRKLLSLPVLAAIVALVVVGGVLALNPPRAELGGTGLDGGSPGAQTFGAVGLTPTEGTTSVPTSESFAPTGAPGTEPTGVPGAGPTGGPTVLPTPRPGSTPVPPGPNPTAGSAPTPTSPPGPTPAPPTPAPPTPAPTAPPTPDLLCTVPDFVGDQSSQVQQRWTNAGFTGAVFFDPPVPPHYRVEWQGLNPGTTTFCIVWILVSDHEQ